MSEELLEKITVAVKEANEAEKNVATARDELVSRSKAVGLLLLEAKKLHPTKKQFEPFLNRVNGLKVSRAYDLMNTLEMKEAAPAFTRRAAPPRDCNDTFIIA